MDEKNARIVSAKVLPFQRPQLRSAEPDLKKDGAESGAESPITRLVELKKHSAAIQAVMRRTPAWITPNGITIFRTLLIVPIWLSLRAGSYWPALGVIAIAFILDFVDGALAEVRNAKTTLGAFLDPLADKIIVCGAMLALMDRLHPGFAPVIWALCLGAAGLTMIRLVKLAKRRQGAGGDPGIAAKPAGKIKFLTEVVAILAIILGLATGITPLLWFGGIVLTLAVLFALISALSQIFE